MKELKQKTVESDFRQINRTASEGYSGVQTFMEIADDKLVEVQLEGNNLMELILSPHNLNAAYRQVMRNGGAGGADKMETSELLPYLKLHRDELIGKLRDGKYRPNPVRRVEIPKDNGKTRPLGIPTVVDRLVQQAVSQVLIPLYEPQFSDNSFGFRPHRSAQDALHRVQEYADQGYRYCIGLDLEKFFDRVNYEETTEGVPQGGPLSPILSNILLNELDKELERRGHPFVRYADDCMILVKSLRATERVRDSISEFIEKKLFLKVNKDKTEVGSIVGKKYLGYTFY